MTFPPGGTSEAVEVEDYEELPSGTPTWVNLSSGAFAGIAEHTVTYPFDSIKVMGYINILCLICSDEDASVEAASRGHIQKYDRCSD